MNPTPFVPMNSAPNVPVNESPAASRPLVLVPACNKMLGDHPYHIAGKKYADAVRLLVRWAEYPYRVRRRTSDAPEELARLAELGHELQEQLQCHQTWVQAENHHVGTLYAKTMASIKNRIAPATAEAWRSEPVETGDGMVLSGWGPGSIDDLLGDLNAAIERRFRWRRLIP